jgi:hypothetical protein
MNDSTQNGSSLATAGWFIRLFGWVICVASFFSLEKTNEPVDLIPFLFSLAVLVGVSLFYFIMRSISERWRAKVVRSYFRPYIVGATIWLALFAISLCFILGRMILNR